MNILIRPLSIDDAAISYKWRNNPEIWKHTGAQYTSEITAQIESDWLKTTLADETKSRFAILVDHEYVGNVQLTDIQLNDTAQFHIFIGNQAYWGKGVAKEATYQILTYAKEVLKLRTVFLEVKNENIAAVKAYEKNGFVVTDTKNNFLIMNCNLQHLQPPMVSIFCMVYNHEPFIAQTLEGFLMQKTNFTTQIVLGEDCSTDGSRGVILEYAHKYPGKFKLLLHNTNIGASNNQQMVFEHCDGKYIAMCEGDDYWTNSLKLQKQVNFLENNPDFSLCFTNVSTQKSNGEILKYKLIPDNRFKKDVFTQDDMLISAPNLSRVFINVFQNNNFILKSGDSALLVYLSTFGKIKFLNIVTGVYRIHEGGTWSMTPEPKQKLMLTNARIDCLELIDMKNQHKFIREILKNIWYLKCLKTKESVLSANQLIIKLKLLKINYTFSNKVKQNAIFKIIDVLNTETTTITYKVIKKIILKIF